LSELEKRKPKVCQLLFFLMTTSNGNLSSLRESQNKLEKRNLKKGYRRDQLILVLT